MEVYRNLILFLDIKKGKQKEMCNNVFRGTFYDY